MIEHRRFNEPPDAKSKHHWFHFYFIFSNRTIYTLTAPWWDTFTGIEIETRWRIGSPTAATQERLNSVHLRFIIGYTQLLLPPHRSIIRYRYANKFRRDTIHSGEKNISLQWDSIFFFWFRIISSFLLFRFRRSLLCNL